MHFDFADMRLVVHIAAHSSFTKGAESSHISVPAASIRIKNLEDAMGAKLLHRGSQGVTLTPPGEAFVQHARTVLGQIEAMRGEIKDYVKGVKGRVRIGANSGVLGEFLPQVLGRYLMSHPAISIDLSEQTDQDIVRSVADAQCDIGIVGCGVHSEKLEVIPYRPDRLVLVVPSGHRFAGRKDIALDEAVDENFVGMPDGPDRAVLDHLRESMANRLRLRGGDLEVACRLIEAGVGVGVMPLSAARRHTRSMDVASVPLADDWAVYELKICVSRQREVSAFVRELVEMLLRDALALARRPTLAIAPAA
jgi:DNA-binding transcriptional LysR family regulator